MRGSGPMSQVIDTRRPKILLLGLNYAPEAVGIAVYSTGLAEKLAADGHEVCVVTAKPSYPAWKVPAEFRGGWLRRTHENGVDVFRVATLVPSNPTGLKRLVHQASFLVSSLLPTLVLAIRRRPDVVLTVAPALAGAPVARLAAALCGARSWLHVQDFEVEAAQATGLLGPGALIRAAGRVERLILGLFHRVSSISPAMCRKLAEKGVRPERIVEFRNWAALDSVVPTEGPSPYRTEWNVTTPHVVLYSGNIANKQGIDIVVDAARRLHRRRDLTFVVCGEGPNRAALQSRAGDLDNLVFRDLQPKERLNDLLAMATVHLLPQLAGAADLVLPSKLTNMLASGRPVVATAHPGTGLAAEVEGCGLLTTPEDGAAFAEAIERLLDDPELRDRLGRNARRRAEERWDRDRIIGRVETEMATLAGLGLPEVRPAE